jgi:proline iminopeptidase
MKSEVALLISLFLFESCDMKKSTPVAEGKAEANGVKLFYKTVGEGEPLVIVHGGPGFDHIHTLPFSVLADDYKVIFYDQRATGNSSGNVDAASITVDNFIEDLEGLRKHLRLEKMHVIGHSWGAVLAAHYAVKYPQNLKTLILLSAYASAEVFTQYFSNIQKNTSAEDSIALKQIEASEAFKNKESRTIEQYYRIGVKPFFHNPSLVGRLDLTLSKTTASNQSVVADLLMRNMGNFDIHDRLSVIKCPTLIVHGDSDPLPVEGPYKVHKFIPQSKLVVLKNTGHFMFVESPGKLFPLVKAFLKNDKSVESSIPIEIEERLKSLFQ